MQNRLRKITVGGLLAALDVVSARFLFFWTPGNIDRISPQFLANGLAGWLLGPWWGAAVCVAADLIGMLMNSSGLVFMPLFTLSAATRGLLYGFLLHRKPVSLRRALIAVTVVTVVVDLGMNPVWISLLYDGMAWWPTFIAKLPVRLATIPVYGGLLFAVQLALSKSGVAARSADVS